MTQSNYFALIKYVSDDVFTVIPAHRIVDFKKMLPMWIKCKSEEEFDKFFNPVEAERGEDAALEQANLVKISQESYKLREYSIKLKASIINGTVDTSKNTKMNLRKRKASLLDGVASTSSANLDSTLGPERDERINSAQKSKRPLVNESKRRKRSSEEKTRKSVDNDEYSYEYTPDVSTPIKGYRQKPDLDISRVSIPQDENTETKNGSAILQADNLPKACAANFEKIYDILEDIKETMKTLSSSKNSDTSEQRILIGGKYAISKSSVAYGLAKSTLERFFRELISAGWKQSEKAGHNLTGLGTKNNVKINQEKLNSYIDYTINAWNDYHNKNNPGSCLIIPNHQLDNKRKGLRSLMGLICQEETRRSNKMKES